MIPESSDNSLRVLVVDNDRETVEFYEKLLRVWKYAAILAEGVGEDLFNDAIKKAEDFRCQIALVDMRLYDDWSEEDISGLGLIEKLKPAETIIASGHGTLKLAVDAVQKWGAAKFFEKKDNPTLLKEMIVEVMKEKGCCCNNITLEPPDVLKYAEEKLSFNGNDAYIPGQIRDIFAHLFSGATALHLEKMDIPASTSFEHITVPRPNSVVLRVREDGNQPFIVKMARKDKIVDEVRRFDKYIKDKLVGRHIPRLESHFALWDIGGIKLSVVGEIEETFSNSVMRRPVEEIERSLEHFFSRVWSDHYQNAKGVRNESLFNMYCEVWGESWVGRALKASLPELPEEWDASLRRKIDAHPLEMFGRINASRGTGDDPSMVLSTRKAVTHGDLHADNLLLDGSQHGWVVDFERSGWGHAFQDFVELESDLINRIICSKIEYAEYYSFCVAVVNEFSVEYMLGHPSVVNGDPAVKKILEIISVIRSLALQCAGIKDFRQYIWGLYFNTIFRATLENKLEKNDERDLYVWIFANILSHRLAHRGEGWLPEAESI